MGPRDQGFRRRRRHRSQGSRTFFRRFMRCNRRYARPSRDGPMLPLRSHGRARARKRALVAPKLAAVDPDGSAGEENGARACRLDAQRPALASQANALRRPPAIARANASRRIATFSAAPPELNSLAEPAAETNRTRTIRGTRPSVRTG